MFQNPHFATIRYALFASALIVVLALLLEPIETKCCYSSFNCFKPDNDKRKRCGDCTSQGRYCGVGSCNIFGCNCDGGCRDGNITFWCWNHEFCDRIKSSSSLLMFSGDQSDIDLDQNLDHSKSSIIVKEFNRSDLNQDGILDFKEFIKLIKALELYDIVEIPIDSSILFEEYNRINSNRGDGGITLDEIDSDFKSI
ncbi:target of rapamycin complex subunit lst8 [Sarcoptes scabiei]|uniref:Uncharacterized protein n=1 Tax=Sarcoptes scabiei TaxID=52283 RepID=A0A131ZX31_SARSC|nr:hypothetical protein QR98_0014780 [Sarcoptes scabiei]UXI21997.1 target of rapamycin complex subunit lst8 [Sarcoptes scabiei]